MFGDQYSYCFNRFRFWRPVFILFLIDLSKLNIRRKFGRRLLHNEAI